MRNWALEPTGKPGVSPLDPNAIPKYVNELTKPPVYVPDNPGSNRLHYTVTYKKIHQQLLPPGFPSTEVFAYGGKADFSEDDGGPIIARTQTIGGPISARPSRRRDRPSRRLAGSASACTT